MNCMYFWTFYDHTGGLNLVYQLCTVYISMDIVFFIIAFFIQLMYMQCDCHCILLLKAT